MEVGSCEMWGWGRVKCGACEMWRCVKCGGGGV